MSPAVLYSAGVCGECRHVSLVPHGELELKRCALCGGTSLAIPGAKFLHAEVPVFEQLERVVHHAQLSKSEAALIAGELESVSLRWERPDIVLHQLCCRLQGLQVICDANQEYSRLLLVSGMLLTLVGARMLDGAAMNPSTRESDIRSLIFEGEARRVPMARTGPR